MSTHSTPPPTPLPTPPLPPASGPASTPSGFNAIVHIPVAWGDMDAFGHVNNVVYFRYLETARVAYVRRFGWFEHQQATGVGVILHSVQARFRAPVVFPDTLGVSARLASIEDDRFTLEHEIVSEKLGVVVATGSGVIVAYSYTGLHKMAIPPELRERMVAELGK